MPCQSALEFTRAFRWGGYDYAPPRRSSLICDPRRWSFGDFRGVIPRCLAEVDMDEDGVGQSRVVQAWGTGIWGGLINFSNPRII